MEDSVQRKDKMWKNKKEILNYLFIANVILLVYCLLLRLGGTCQVTTEKDTLSLSIQEHKSDAQDKAEKGIVGSNIVKSTEEAINKVAADNNEETVTENEATYYLREYQEKYEQIPKDDMKEWYIQYKRLTEEYSSYIKKRITIYDVFAPEELNLLFAIVEAEVRGDIYFDEKSHVASVILNRLKSSDFPNDLYEVLTAPQQFASYTSGIYAQIPIYETTILACEYAFECGDNTNGALYFDSRGENSWNIGINEYIFSDGVGHSFYK